MFFTSGMSCKLSLQALWFRFCLFRKSNIWALFLLALPLALFFCLVLEDGCELSASFFLSGFIHYSLVSYRFLNDKLNFQVSSMLIFELLAFTSWMTWHVQYFLIFSDCMESKFQDLQWHPQLFWNLKAWTCLHQIWPSFWNLEQSHYHLRNCRYSRYKLYSLKILILVN